MDDEQKLLTRIVHELAALLDSRYAALGILGPDGGLTHFITTGLTEEEEAALRHTPPHGKGILGALLTEGHPLRLDDLTKDPRSVGFPPGHPPMWTFLGVPLLVGDRVLGRLYVTEKKRGRFTQEDESLALGFAGAAAVAIQSARQAAQLVQNERLRSTGELAMGVAHDFNNLLATILGRTEVLLGQVRDSEQRESLQAIRRAARDGAAVVSRMREYGRPVDTTEFRLVDLADVAAEAVQLTRPRWQGEAQRQGRTIEVQQRLSSATVLADPAALREVLVNLLFNAIDALPGGGTISLSLATRGDRVHLEVADTGAGIPAHVQSRVFEPFFTTKGAQGSGLGLPMVRKVVEAHGGSVTVDSGPGRGAIFRIDLPAAVGDAVPVSPDAPLDDAELPPAHVVVVDDQQDVLDTIGMLLRRDGHYVRLFHDPHAAVESVAHERPDVVITDIGMPRMSGWDLARSVRERVPGLPVIVLTGWGRDVTEAQLKQHGVLAALSKPAELGTLRQALARALTPARERPLHVLLVDDAAAFASVLAVLISQGGHTVRRVGTAGEGIAALESDEDFDLVMLDLNLPDRPSAEVLAAARAAARVPVVCVASGSAPHAMQREVPGADLYVEKAYVTEQLAQILRTAQDRQRAQGTQDTHA
ncbi:MAG TPA: response regulator [Chloroflexota bacterium]|nr:response regulator [Chloroflexota bacterium]